MSCPSIYSIGYIKYNDHSIQQARDTPTVAASLCGRFFTIWMCLSIPTGVGLFINPLLGAGNWT